LEVYVAFSESNDAFGYRSTGSCSGPDCRACPAAAARSQCARQCNAGAGGKAPAARAIAEFTPLCYF